MPPGARGKRGKDNDRRRGTGKRTAAKTPEQVGTGPNQRDAQPDLWKVHKTVGHLLQAGLHDVDRRRQHCQIPEPADRQPAFPAPCAPARYTPLPAQAARPPKAQAPRRQPRSPGTSLRGPRAKGSCARTRCKALRRARSGATSRRRPWKRARRCAGSLQWLPQRRGKPAERMAVFPRKARSPTAASRANNPTTGRRSATSPRPTSPSVPTPAPGPHVRGEGLWDSARMRRTPIAPASQTAR